MSWTRSRPSQLTHAIASDRRFKAATDRLQRYRSWYEKYLRASDTTKARR